MSGVFICYRRADSATFVDRLAEDLRRHFGEDEIFLDVVSIIPGTPFPSELDRRIKRSNAVLVVIGQDWLNRGSGMARIKEGGDYVRKEIEAALCHGICLIPVLTAGARMPKEEELPDSLSEFAKLQAIEISRTHYHSDIEILVRRLQKLVKPSRGTLLALFSAGQYEFAIKALKSSIENFPEDADNHFYLALGLLRGRRPRTLTVREAREIETHLRTSCNLNPRAAHPYLVWASIKWDFFVVNGFSPPEEVLELLQQVEDRTIDPEALRAICSSLRVSEGNPLAEILSAASQNL